jgi:hypothetical protein
MIKNRTRVAMVGAALIAVLSLGGLIGLPKAFGDPPGYDVPPFPSDAYIADVLECFGDNFEACCTDVAYTNAQNAHEAIACFISTCGPGNIPPVPPGSISSLTELVRLFFGGVGPNADNPCED